MVEAALNQATKQNGPRFGAGIDAREAGRRGGQASGVSRRLRPIRELEAGIIQSRNGAAKAKLLEQKRRDAEELLERRLDADRMVAELDSLAYDLRATIEDLGDEIDERRLEVAALEQRKQELEAAAGASSDQLVERLRALNENHPDTLDAMLEQLGCFERDADAEAEAAP